MCVCVCVFEIHVLKILIERWFWEIFVLIGSLIELYVGLHSYLCFSPLKKLFWKASSTPPQYLAIYRASQAFFLTQSRYLLDTWWINRESSCLLDSSSTPGGSIELLFLNLIFVSRYLLDTSAIDDQFLDTYLDSFLDSSRYLSYRALLKGLYILPSRSFSYFFDLSATVHLPNTLFFTPNPFLKVSSSFFKFFYTWQASNPSLFMHFMF